MGHVPISSHVMSTRKQYSLGWQWWPCSGQRLEIPQPILQWSVRRCAEWTSGRPKRGPCCSLGFHEYPSVLLSNKLLERSRVYQQEVSFIFPVVFGNKLNKPSFWWFKTHPIQNQRSFVQYLQDLLPGAVGNSTGCCMDPWTTRWFCPRILSGVANSDAKHFCNCRSQSSICPTFGTGLASQNPTFFINIKKYYMCCVDRGF